MVRRISAPLVGAVLTLLLVGIAGCGATDETSDNATQQSADATSMTLADPSMTGGQTGMGAMAPGEVTLPADWPNDLPIYPGTQVIATIDYALEGTRNVGATLDSTDDPKTINDWYVTEVQKAGWKITGQGETEGNYVISGTKGTDQLTVAIAIGLGTEHTSVNVSKIILE